ncbi:MAG: hypothetical protein ABI658_32125 [Acidimicrobiales bacterium]
MLKTASSLDEFEKSLPRRLAIAAMLGWLIAFVIISTIIYIAEPSAGWPMVLGAGAFASFLAGPYFGGGVVVARYLSRVEAAERQTLAAEMTTERGGMSELATKTNIAANRSVSVV